MLRYALHDTLTCAQTKSPANSRWWGFLWRNDSHLLAHKRNQDLFLITLTARAAGLFPAAVIFIHRSPGTGFGFLFGHAALLIAFLNVLGLTLLFVSILRLISLWHGSSKIKVERKRPVALGHGFILRVGWGRS
jgi:hypothetical protein